jgi:hypothetical protein
MTAHTFQSQKDNWSVARLPGPSLIQHTAPRQRLAAYPTQVQNCQRFQLPSTSNSLQHQQRRTQSYSAGCYCCHQCYGPAEDCGLLLQVILVRRCKLFLRNFQHSSLIGWLSSYSLEQKLQIVVFILTSLENASIGYLSPNCYEALPVLTFTNSLPVNFRNLSVSIMPILSMWNFNRLDPYINIRQHVH